MTGINYQAYNRFQEPEDYECFCEDCGRPLSDDEGHQYKLWILCDDCYRDQLERDAEEENRE